MKFNKMLLLVGAVALPYVTSAAPDLINASGQVKFLLDTIIPIMITVAVIYFFWGLAKYILESEKTDKKEEGRNIMIYGLIALFVMLSVWGLIGAIGATFDIGQGGSVPIPTI
jgi:Kef-type K+ transport system membrane component KefB